MKNVILITVDSLRADCLKQALNINSLAKQSCVFDNAFSTGPVSSHSFISILTSTYPLDFTGPKKIEEPRVLLQQVFKKQGFTTAAFHSANYLRNYFSFEWDVFNKIGSKAKKMRAFKNPFRIFERIFLNTLPSFVFRTRYLLHKMGVVDIRPGLKAADLNKQIKEFIKDRKRPFFLWVHYIDVHEPYLPYDVYFKNRKLCYKELVGYYFSKTKNKRFLKKHVKEAENLYQDGIRYLDKELGDLFDFFKKENIWSDSVIVFTSDHGDDFLGHGISHYEGLYNDLLHVPLIFKIPGKKPERIKKKVSLIDLAPTICDLAGIKKSPSFKGRNLFAESREIIFHQTGKNLSGEERDSFVDINDITQCKIACQTNSFKYILDFNNKKEELYNLLADPGEKNNISDINTLKTMRKNIKWFKKQNPLLQYV